MQQTSHTAALRGVGFRLESVADELDTIADELDTWHWTNAGAVIVAPDNHGLTIGRAVNRLMDTAHQLREASRAHLASADREEARTNGRALPCGHCAADTGEPHTAACRQTRREPTP